MCWQTDNTSALIKHTSTAIGILGVIKDKKTENCSDRKHCVISIDNDSCATNFSDNDNDDSTSESKLLDF